MGICSGIIAIGPYSKSIVRYMDVPGQHSKTCEGSIVSRQLFGLVEGTTLSREFAALVGVTDPWDFNQHKLHPEHFDFDGLREFAQVYPDYYDDVEALAALVREGFEFHFRLEGLEA